MENKKEFDIISLIQNEHSTYLEKHDILKKIIFDLLDKDNPWEDVKEFLESRKKKNTNAKNIQRSKSPASNNKEEVGQKTIKIDLCAAQSADFARRQKISKERHNSPQAKVYDRLYANAQEKQVKQGLTEMDSKKGKNFAPIISKKAEELARAKKRGENKVEEALYEDALKRQKEAKTIKILVLIYCTN